MDGVFAGAMTPFSPLIDWCCFVIFIPMMGLVLGLHVYHVGPQSFGEGKIQRGQPIFFILSCAEIRCVEA